MPLNDVQNLVIRDEEGDQLFVDGEHPVDLTYLVMSVESVDHAVLLTYSQVTHLTKFLTNWLEQYKPEDVK